MSNQVQRSALMFFDIINKIMNEQEDQFFVEPQIEQVHDIQPLEDANPIIEKAISQQSKYVPLRMVDVPKAQQSCSYKPFHFKKQESQQEEDEEVHYDYQSPFTQYYDPEQCVYQRHHNRQFNRVRETMYFAGGFFHQNIFLEGNFSDNIEISDVASLYYDQINAELPKASGTSLKFDSRFQSGNLFAAFKVNNNQYDLVMSNDVNSTGNNQWFYFSVEGMVVDKEYTFNVVNFTKTDSLFNYGMTPVIYSMAENKGVKGADRGWRRDGKEVSYKKGEINRQNSRRMYYKLSFKLSTLFQNDKIYIAHSYPYTTQKLNKYLSDKVSRHRDVVTKVTVGKTLSKRVIEGLVITYPAANKKKDSRKAIFVMARQHPGQCQGSYVCEGVVDKLLSKAKEADFLLKNYVIYVIPMVNVDGVVFGHYRTNLSGKDLNRKWNVTERQLTCPQVTSIKNFIQEVSKQRTIRFILDLHGHSKKLNSFFYGNPYPQNPDVVRIFPYVCSRLHSGVQYLDCTFASEEYKRKAARVYLSFLYRLIHVYTFESSFYAYFKDGKKIQFTPKQYRELGGILINGLSMQLEHEIKFQQSFEFALKKNNREYSNSPFVKFVAELKNNRQYMEWGCKNQSGSESKPEEGEVEDQNINNIKLKTRPLSTKTEDPQSAAKTTKSSRKGPRQCRQYSFNKPIRNIKFLEISRVNSILPDKYQLGLQPIKKKELPADPVIKPQTAHTRILAQSQTEPKGQLKTVEFKQSQIEKCVLSNSVKVDLSHQRKFSSVIRSNNRNIIFKFDILGHTTARQQDLRSMKAPLIYKHAYSQTMITYSKEQGQKIRNSQVLPEVQTPDKDELKWARTNSIRVQSSIRSGIKREAELYFNGMVKKLMNERDQGRQSEFSNKFVAQKPLSIKKKEIYKK